MVVSAFNDKVIGKQQTRQPKRQIKILFGLLVLSWKNVILDTVIKIPDQAVIKYETKFHHN